MRFAKILALALIVGALGACKYESIPDPAVSGKDAEWLALAPQPSKVFDPYTSRMRVSYSTREAPGTIVINSDAKFLYFVEQGGTAIRYPISVGQDEYIYRGDAVVGRKAEWPSWTPMAEARKLNPSLPATVHGGPENPLGARGLYLYEGGKDTYIRIHGTNEPEYIGRNVSLGCIRMNNIDVIDLYNRVKIGSKVVVS
jgi:lipoprotein-anchoring transpeptidase ErfK/SrfK